VAVSQGPVVSNTTPLINLVGVGTLSVLLEAKKSGLLPALRPVVDEMIRQGRHISARLKAQVLQAAGE
jgi:uncharacterized protein